MTEAQLDDWLQRKRLMIVPYRYTCRLYEENFPSDDVFDLPSTLNAQLQLYLELDTFEMTIGRIAKSPNVIFLLEPKRIVSRIYDFYALQDDTQRSPPLYHVLAEAARFVADLYGMNATRKP